MEGNDDPTSMLSPGSKVHLLFIHTYIHTLLSNIYCMYVYSNPGIFSRVMLR